MYVAVLVLTLVVVVGVVGWICDRFGWPSPLALLVVGVALASVPGVPDVALNPEVVLLGLLPPLLYSAALQLSLFDFRRNKVPAGLLSVGAVVFTAAAVGLVAAAVLPAIGLAAAFALGAVVAPPDAVAATAVGRRIGMPRRITALLEDESLFNDATALVLLTTTTTALARTVTPGEVVGLFALAAGGGVVIGVVAGFALGAVRKRIQDPTLDTVLSFAAPFVAYLPAEAVGASGVLAVVVTGLMLAHGSTTLQSAASRVVERTTWTTVGWLLEQVVFLLIGLQLPALLGRVVQNGPGVGVDLLVCAAVLGATMAARALFVFGVQLATVIFPSFGPATGWADWTWRVSAVVSWSGMRGVVTLAAAYLLPDDIPQVDLLRLAAFVVVAGTLLAQGLTLPSLVRRLGLRGPDAAEDALASASVVDQASRAGLARLDQLLRGDEPDGVEEALRRRSVVRTNSAWERLGRPESGQATPSGTYRRLRVAMIEAERASITRARDSGQWDDEILRRALSAVDVEESLLDRSDDEEQAANRARDLVVERDGDCEHLRAAPRVIRLITPGECAACTREGTSWVHLRGCLSCGTVSCCDSSPRRHADAHFREMGHPVMRSVESGEAWRWCYVDVQTG